jgi:vancomycin permeability regulator SanA
MLRLAAAAVVAAVLAAVGVLSFVGLVDHVEPADAAIVPGNTVFPDGTPSDRLKGRLDAALALFQAGHCRLVVVSGATGAEGVDESEVMKRYLVERGVPPERVLQDSQGSNTAATARNVAAVLRERGSTRVLAVSQFFHVPRLRRLLAAEGLTVVGQAHARYFEPRDVYSVLREVVAMGVLLVKGEGLPPSESVK